MHADVHFPWEGAARHNKVVAKVTTPKDKDIARGLPKHKGGHTKRHVHVQSHAHGAPGGSGLREQRSHLHSAVTRPLSLALALGAVGSRQRKGRDDRQRPQRGFNNQIFAEQAGPLISAAQHLGPASFPPLASSPTSHARLTSNKGRKEPRVAFSSTGRQRGRRF